jgi:asparagine synthase (glutamine-hydrolysing)
LAKKFSKFSSWDVIQPVYERFNSKAWDKSPLHWMTYLDLNLRLPELLLMRVDKMSMGVSLECRVPFLDHKFVELVMSIPAAVKIKNGNRKYLLKRTVRGLIPDDLINRRKQGFGVPIQEWILGSLGEYARQELEWLCKESDFFNPLEVREIINQKNSNKIWFLLNFSLWWKQYINSAPY